MKTTLAILILALAAPLCAKEELVTLPKRDSVQLTIYNSEDLTLVRETRTLSFKQGENRIQFSWANTLIDPTSVEFQAVGDKDGNIEVADTSYPAESHEMLIWTISAKKASSHQVQISYFTSGISWSAEYIGLVNADESAMDLTGFVTVHNRSGEEYENAQVRLVVGVIHLVEKIIYLAQGGQPRTKDVDDWARSESRKSRGADEGPAGGGGMSRPKEIDKTGLSEYYIYTVEGTETIPHGWSKRLRSFAVAGVPMKTVYHFEPAKYGAGLMKVLEFKNNEEHKLGKEPLPDGIIRLYKLNNGGMGYMGALVSKYIAKNDEVKINVGADPEVTLKEKRMSFEKTDLVFQSRGSSRWVSGWTTVEKFELEVKNFRNKNIEVEIHRSAQGDFDFESEDKPEKENFNTMKFKFALNANNARKLNFTITTRNGDNVKKK
ncbi:MAG: DUF4139 domain-containing protein [Planctomycetes bacterium]|nr:DUF4139 domain-containing protein [Planctomycetota bacterium]